MSPAPATDGLVGRLRQQARAILSGFTTGQRAMTAIAVVAVVVGGYMFMSWAGKPTYAPLFSNLSGTDAAAITSKLTSAKVPYQLADGGATVLVPANAVYQQRLNMSSAGLPGNSESGYALLNKAGVTTSQFQQQVDYQQAVQTELDHTIEALQGVTAAVVHVVIPTDTAFAGSSSAPSASVLVKMAPGQQLNPSQVQAVVHLVASSIQNLDPANVTVVDDKGDVLSAPGTNSAALAAGGAQDQQTQQFDQSLGNKLTTMLAKVVGDGNAVVTVSADLDFSQTQTTSKTYDPAKTGPIQVSNASSVEQYSGNGAAAAAAGGVLGQAGTAGATPATTTGTSGSYTHNNTSSNAVVSETDQTRQNAPGAVNRLSVAVVVNQAVKGVTPAQIQSVVAGGAGLLPSRGDTISVAMLPFDTSAQAAASKELTAAAKAHSSSQMMGMVRTAVVVLVVLGLLAYALRRLTKTTRTELALPDGWAPAALEAAPAVHEEPTLVLQAVGGPPAVTGSPTSGQALAQLADQDPGDIARLLRSWLAEEHG